MTDQNCDKSVSLTTLELETNSMEEKKNAQQTIITNSPILTGGPKCNTFNIHTLQKEKGFPRLCSLSFNQSDNSLMHTSKAQMNYVCEKELILEIFDTP